MTVKGLHNALKWRRRSEFLNIRINAALNPIIERMGLCDVYRPHSAWMTWLADVLFVDCVCCILFRGVAIGLAIGLLIAYIFV